MEAVATNTDKLKLHAGGAKENRRELDFYPTPKAVTRSLINFLLNRNIINTGMKVWEPACGNGKMSETIKEFLPDVYSSDIRDTGYGSPFMDFTKHVGNSNFDAIITNPPFNQSKKFIQVAISKADIVCMLLKSQYWHAANKQGLFNKHTPSYILPLTWRADFLEDEITDKKGNPTMPPNSVIEYDVFISERTGNGSSANIFNLTPFQRHLENLSDDEIGYDETEPADDRVSLFARLRETRAEMKRARQDSRAERKAAKIEARRARFEMFSDIDGMDDTDISFSLNDPTGE